MLDQFFIQKNIQNENQKNINFNNLSKNIKNRKFMSKAQFQSSIKQIGKNVNAYVKYASKSPYACIVLHEHLGLVQNMVKTTQFLLGSKISLMIPDLFLSVTSKTLLNNQFDAIKKLKFNRILEAVQSCLKELSKNHSKFLLMGFSIGSAYGFKILQKMPDTFESAFLFYGVPNITNWNPSAIKTKTVSFYGSDDKIKYLSDMTTYDEITKKCKSNPSIKFERINGTGHGFVNPDSTNFSEKAILYCQKIMFTYLPQQLISHPDAGKIEESGKKKQDCIIF